MGDNRSDLPEGTDAVIEGAANTDESSSLPQGSGAEATSGAVTVDTDLVEATQAPRPVKSGLNSDVNFAQRLRDGSEKLSTQAGERARGFVSTGLERSSEALANVGRLVGDTAAGLDERLGEEYGDYARRAASAIESTANSLAEKDPDELIEDTRNFVRNSPGVAIAGAAIVGFAVARLLKSGLSSNRDEDDRA